jgi:hypothetical protein
MEDMTCWIAPGNGQEDSQVWMASDGAVRF